MYFLVDQVKKRIKSLRTQYGKLKKPLPTGSEAKVLSKKNKWILDHLQFLAPYMIFKPTTSNLEVFLIILKSLYLQFANRVDYSFTNFNVGLYCNISHVYEIIFSCQ